MAESISRSLRDGSLEGEHAQALTIKDSLQCPLGSHAFNHFLSILVSNISTAKSQARVRVLDCYSDPLGWKDQNSNSGNYEKGSATVFKDLKDISKLFSSILDLGRGFVGDGKTRFAVAMDSVSAILRHAPLPSVAGLISNLRCHDQISCMFWLIHSDLHEPRATSSLEYISTMVAGLEPMIQSTVGQKSPENLYWLEQNYHSGKFHVRLKRRNGRVKLLNEEFHVEQGGIKFTAVSSESTLINQNLVPKVQFNLQLSEKEKIDRAKVVLPFEHQGNGESIQIYDGRRSLTDEKMDPHSVHPPSAPTGINSETSKGAGEIHYIRDSDDEAPDSDEDPDDDLDI